MEQSVWLHEVCDDVHMSQSREDLHVHQSAGVLQGLGKLGGGGKGNCHVSRAMNKGQCRKSENSIQYS